MKLGLGTVQFGLDYGIANTSGRVPPPVVASMLELAGREGLTVIDTAHLYGDSERVLGGALPPDESFRFVTKTPRFGGTIITERDADLLESALEQSLKLLRRSRVYGLLIHHAPDALAEGGERLFARMVALKERGKVERIGVSVYDPDQLERALERHPIDLVQVPFNVLDQRLLRRPALLERLERGRVEVHGRSAFLQGLLLMEPASLDPYFAPWRPVLEEYQRRVRGAGLSPLSAALRFAAESQSVGTVIFGACSVAEMAGAIAAAREAAPLPTLADLAVDDEALVNPSRWPPARRAS
jgi:aryl-alcohol dehydrogenase-like predicted oxidoreductase